ncbi:MAG: hypothetical protein HYR74_03810 [Candidatus Eisenbacteria bacterium]|nr:hypothetical protein [Candidatus Eisenbacteria bacterium]
MMKRIVVLLALALLVPASAFAAGAAVTSYGLRAGFSTSPDQLVLGGQMAVSDIAPSISFDPNVEFGFGDSETVIAFNLDLHYHFALRNTSWSPYIGAGAGINFFSVDVPPGFPGDNTFTEVGGNIILGASVPTKSGHDFFGEMKLGLGDIPSFKLLAGLNFGH